MNINNSISFLFIFSLLVFFSCKERKIVSDFDKSVIKLDLRGALNKTEKLVFLSELTDEIKYIPLETNNLCLLHGVHKILFAKEYIFISDSRGLYQFDLSGRFVRQIGSPGKGPGEHGQRIIFNVDILQKEILLFSSTLMNVYDLETGSFKRRFNVDLDVSDFTIFPKGYIAFFTNEFPKNAVASTINEVYKVDNKGEILDTIPNYNRLNINRNSRGYANVFSISRGKLHYMYNYSDTLFILNENFSKRPYKTLNLGNTINPNNLLIEPIFNEIQLPDFLWVHRIHEIQQHIFITCQLGITLSGDPNLNYLLYNKESGDLSLTSGFINDIDGGIAFWPAFTMESTLISHYQPHQIIEYYNSTNGTTNHSDIFINLVKNLNEGDNPVLVFAEYKSTE